MSDPQDRSIVGPLSFDFALAAPHPPGENPYSVFLARLAPGSRPTMADALVSIAIHYAEHLFDYWRETGSLAGGNRELLAKIVWPHFFAIQILIIVMIFSYCVLRELIRVIGRRKVLHMFFGAPVVQN